MLKKISVHKHKYYSLNTAPWKAYLKAHTNTCAPAAKLTSNQQHCWLTIHTWFCFSAMFFQHQLGLMWINMHMLQNMIMANLKLAVKKKKKNQQQPQPPTGMHCTQQTAARESTEGSWRAWRENMALYSHTIWHVNVKLTIFKYKSVRYT